MATVAYPDLSGRHEPEISALSLAFVVEQKTSEAGVSSGCDVCHCARPFSLPAGNWVLELSV